MHDLIYGIGALAGWIAFVYKLNHLRQDWTNPALRAMVAAFGFSAVAFTLTVGLVYQPIDAALGVPNLTKLFIHSFMVLFSVCVLQLLAFWQYPAPRARHRARVYWAVGLVIVAAMSALIVVAPIHDRYTIHFWKTHAGETLMLWYLVMFLVALSAGLLAIAYRSWHFAGLTAQLPWLRRGLRLTALGALVSFGYCACRGSYLILISADVRVEPLVDIAQPFASLGQIVFFAGLTMPGWGPKTRVDQLSAYRALEPLWSALHDAFPGIALHSAAEGDSVAVGDVNYRLYRRMVEIWDGYLALRPYLPASAAVRPGEPLASDDAARMINEGLKNRQEGYEPAAALPEQPPSVQDNELEWLIAVSRSFARMRARELDHA
ncbi:MAB_1171c family putative transporter [Plantactinospora solaniradicis]|uniref:MAB_1171c family putative transporter n=1 Tax=Plantactinospora solaniradicis TaxID=1723736 RepID=A0ABW1K8S7_9ACTN